MRAAGLAVALTAPALFAAGDGPSAVSPAVLQSQSRYVSLTADREVREQVPLLTVRLDLPRAAHVLVHSDGAFAPTAVDSAARVWIEVDGRAVTNESAIDWHGSAVPVRHSFNVVGSASLRGGSHVVRLVGAPRRGAFTVAARTNLSVFVEPTERISTARLGAPAGPFDYTSLDLRGDALPHARLLSVRMGAPARAVALASATTRVAGHDGDSMLGIYVNGRHPGPGTSLWTVNDTCSCAEIEGPVFTHALLPKRAVAPTISLDATEFPWRSRPPFSQSDNPAVYAVQPTAALTVVGNPRVAGKGTVLIPGFPDQLGTAWDFVCIGSSSAWPGCPPMRTNVPLAEGSFVIPRGHSGVVLFVAKARVQGDSSDPGGTVSLRLVLDGVRVGSTGAQELRAPFSVSQRTLSASYLAAGKHRLRPGRHVVRVEGRAEGRFVHITLSRDVPLIWFG